MAWAKLCDSALTHPKLWSLPDDAFAFWIRAILYASAHLTDGVLDARAIAFLRPKKKVLRRLIDDKLIDKRSDGLLEVHDFLVYNPTRKQVLEEREKARSRMKIARVTPRNDSKPGEMFGRTSDEQKPNVQENFASSSPSPTRPDPTRPEKKFQPAAASVAREAPPPPADPPPATPARAAEPAAKPPPEAPRATGGSGGDLESQLVGLLENDKHLVSLHADVPTLVERVAYAADAKRPAHVLAAVRKALDVAAASSWGLTPTVKTVLAYASKASEADLPSAGGKAGKAAALESKPARWTVLQSGSEEHRKKIADHFDFRRSCGWDVGKPWPLPEMVAAGWREGMPWLPDPMPLAKTSPDPSSGPANGNVEGKRRPKAGGEA